MATTLNIDFSNTQGQITLLSEVGSGRNSNSSKMLRMSLLLPRIKKIRIKTRIVRESDYSPASQHFCRVKKTNLTGNYHKLDLVNIDVHTKFGLIMSICSQDIERKRNSEVNKGP